MNERTKPKDSVQPRVKPGLIMTTSWDDGHPLDIRVASLLVKYGLQGTFYVPGESGHALLSDAYVRDLAQDFEVGGHTLRHADLTAVADAVARTEIAGSRRCIEEITGKACKSFCFPKGRFGHRHLAMARDAGFAAARTVELFSLDAPRYKEGLALIPTTVQAYPHKPLAYWKNCAKRFKVNNLRHAIRCGTIRDWSSVAISMLARASRLSGVFHLWGHSWEIDEAGQWQNLERVFAAMELRKRDGICVTNFGLCQAYI